MDKIVYHYTSLESMMSVVDKKALWCTAISYLNDSTEREFLLSAARRRLPILQSIDPSIPTSLQIPKSSRVDPRDVTLFASEPFVTSFSSGRDSLMHWRAYTPQQSGVALGFRTECLRNARLDEDPLVGMVVPAVGFGSVGYVDPGNDAEVDAAIRQAYAEATSSASKHTKPDRIPEFFEWAIDIIAATSKHKLFEVEDEYRLLQVGIQLRENCIRFRTVRSTLVPYVAMRVPSTDQSNKIPWDAIAEVVIGPTANMDLTERSIKSFFAINGMPVNVVKSQIPYRDW